MADLFSPTAPTAQTSGFAQADDAPSSQQIGTSSSVTEGQGGLASNPLVPKPGTSINPETGKPHTAGLTRAELQAKREAEEAVAAAAGVTASSDFGDAGASGGGFASNPLVPQPGTSINPETGKPHMAGLTRAELQAKRDAEDAVAAAAGVTASSDFGETGAGAFGGGSGGGFASNPLVPKPGTSINPETGKPHTAGMTRAELQAKRDAEAAASAPTAPSAVTSPTSPTIRTEDIDEEKPVTSAEVPPNQPGQTEISEEELQQIKAKGAELLDPTPLSQQARRGSHSQTERPPIGSIGGDRRLSDLAGREQAARQLNGTAAAPTAGEITPGLELPGAWGPFKTVPFPGTAPGAPTSIYEDVTDGLNKVGQAAFAAIPSPLKDAFSSQQPPKSPKATTSPRLSSSGSPRLGAPPLEQRRSSVTALFDQAKEKATKVASEVQGTLQNTQRRASSSLTRDDGLFKNVKGFVNEAFTGPGPAAASRDFGIGIYPTGPGRGAAMHITPRVSLPSQEPVGAVPGEHSSGVGALPGPENEAGVAVLPAERRSSASASSSAQANQGVRPGETFGTLPGKVGESDKEASASKAYAELKPAGAWASSIGSSASPSGSGVGSGLGVGTGLPSGSRSSDFDSDIPTTGTASSRPVGHTHAPAPLPIAEEPRREESTPTSSTTGTSHGQGPASIGAFAAAVPAAALISSNNEPAIKASSTVADSAPREASTTAAPDFTPSSSKGNHSSLRTAYGGLGGLAAALPATTLGQGADKGATDVPVAIGSNEVPTAIGSPKDDFAPSFVGTASSTAQGSTASSLLSPDQAVPETRHANERTTSSASVTAIRHGHEGSVSKSSPLAGDGVTVPEHEELSTTTTSPIGSGSGLKSTTSGTGPHHTTSLTPGNEHEGIGHPSTRNVEGATRVPTAYPAAEHGHKPVRDDARSTGTGHHAVVDTRDGDETTKVPAFFPNTEEAREVGPGFAHTSDATESGAGHRAVVDTRDGDETTSVPAFFPNAEEAREVGPGFAAPSSTANTSTPASSFPSDKTHDGVGYHSAGAGAGAATAAAATSLPSDKKHTGEHIGGGPTSTVNPDETTNVPAFFPDLEAVREIGPGFEHGATGGAGVTGSHPHGTTTSTVPGKLDEERRKADAVVDAPAQSQHGAAATTPAHAHATGALDSAGRKADTVSPTTGESITTGSATSAPVSDSKTSTVDSRTGTGTGVSATTPSSTTTPSRVSTSTPSSPRTGTSAADATTGSLNGKTASGHLRNASTGSGTEKKKGGFLGKLKEKLNKH